MPLTLEQLLEIASEYRDTTRDYYVQQEDSPQFKRLAALWRQELLNIDRWHGFLDAVEGELPGFTIGDGTAPLSPCFRCVAYATSNHPLLKSPWAVVGCMSILAPVYALYGVEFELDENNARNKSTVLFEPLPTHMASVAGVIAKQLEAEFAVTALPSELAQTPVPLFVESKYPPETTLFHALFIDRPEIIP